MCNGVLESTQTVSDHISFVPHAKFFLKYSPAIGRITWCEAMGPLFLYQTINMILLDFVFCVKLFNLLVQLTAGIFGSFEKFHCTDE